MSAFVLLALMVTACGSDLGVGAPACEDEVRSPTAAMILTAQAVPTARFGPCVEGLKLGWDGVAFSAEDGRAGFAITRGESSFVTVELTPSCDIGGAREVPSDQEGVARYEQVQAVGNELHITVVPSSDRSLIYARMLANAYPTEEVSGRLVRFTVDDDLTQPILARANRATLRGHLVFIVTDLDVEGGTVERRTDVDGSTVRLDLPDALDEIEGEIPEVSYRGRWLFVFEGGCITYNFDAEGQVAEGLAEDITLAVGLYDLAELRAGARRLGFPIEVPAGS